MSSGLEELKIGAHELRLGMYVARLDRSWVGTPFAMQGVMLTTVEQIRTLGDLCTHVYIDVLKSTESSLEPSHKTFRSTSSRASIWPAQRIEYEDTASIEEELPRAKQAQERIEELASRIVDDVRAGRKLSAMEINDAVVPVVKSVLRSADAYFWINTLRKRDKYSYSHAINCSALAAALGRHIGFNETALVDMASGGLLLDIGKSAVPDEILNQPGPLDEDQRRIVEQHVEHGIRVIEETGIQSERVRDMLRTHHERHDGSGYPAGLGGSSVPLMGRIAAVIDSFDAMTTDRPYRKARPRHEAMQQLYRESDTLYQREVVEQLTQCLGVYPTGSLVELNNGKVGIVMAQNRARSLRPRLIILTDADKKLDPGFHRLNLMDQPETGASDELLRIVRTLQPGAYGLDPTELYL